MQDNKENKNSIITNEENFEMELVFEDENIIWGIEFLNDNSILASVKSGSIYHYKNGVKTEINGLPEIYFRGQGGLLDIALHPEFKENKWLYLSYASEDIKGKGGNTLWGSSNIRIRRHDAIETMYGTIHM